MYPDVHFYTKTRNHRKTIQKTSEIRKKTTTYRKLKKYSIPKYALNGGPVLTFNLPGGCTSGSYATVVHLCCILLLHKNRAAGFQDIQSCKIEIVARACNIRWILHQSCPMKTQHFSPGAGNLFDVTGRMNYVISLAGRSNWLISSWRSTFIIQRKTRRELSLNLLSTCLLVIEFSFDTMLCTNMDHENSNAGQIDVDEGRIWPADRRFPPVLFTNEKSSYLTNNTVSQWSANCGPPHLIGSRNTYYWAPGCA